MMKNWCDDMHVMVGDLYAKINVSGRLFGSKIKVGKNCVQIFQAFNECGK